MLEKKFFWAPGASWCITEEGLEINNYLFQGNMKELFPKFYYLCSEGTTLDELIDGFDPYPKIKLRKFIRTLEKLNLITDKVQDIGDMFAPQGRLFQPEEKYDDNYFMNSDNLAKYVEKQLPRELHTSCEDIELEKTEEPDFIADRRSIRSFAADKKVTFKQFSAVLNVLRQTFRGEKRAYYYPSAGGLYPIDFYVHIKEKRVDGIAGGLYYYNSLRHCLCRISDAAGFNRDMHYFLNKDIYETSAFSVYLFYNASVTMPKYGEKGYYYGILDAGIAIGYITSAAQRCGVSLCSIGDMQFDMISDEFMTDQYQKYLHCIEFGIAE